MDSSSKKDQALWTSLDLIKSGAQLFGVPATHTAQRLRDGLRKRG